MYRRQPADRRVVGKGEAVNWNEGQNRLMRRTKGYSKGVALPAYSLALGRWLWPTVIPAICHHSRVRGNAQPPTPHNILSIPKTLSIPAKIPSPTDTSPLPTAGPF